MSREASRDVLGWSGSLQLRSRIRAAGLTQDELANRLKISSSQLGRYLNGRRRIPAGTFIEICIELHLDPIKVWTCEGSEADDDPTS